MKAAVNSVTLRSSAPEEVVETLLAHGISAVEWVGNEHVPPGDLKRARSVRELCESSGLICASYGSYYPCDEEAGGSGQFSWNRGADPVLETARTLGVSSIRVWAGRQASALASIEYRDEVRRCLSSFCDKAADFGMTVHLEFHRNTLADTADSTVELIEELGRRNLYSYWQPRHGVDLAGNLEDISILGDRISNVHVFHWLLQEDGFSVDRRPLSEGRERWAAYIQKLRTLAGDRYAMLEFVLGDCLEQFSEDTSVLKGLLEGSEG
ncbi:sugar phosphate isomerase/epimerase family protein [Pelagicoccus mobilis]|uniref:TIM barrel protein n=1 Tax=Pelagicoccus mobilis TaxID=415221 RepID=A0A934RS11_9BACT|nr:sugar phosphate isomerase/epimerase [Pelagicoccus mobilis]MBK1875338.1 TIM barrel protein [Pelagicoccus mobilis]